MTDKEFGIPEQKKFPLDTRAHVISAIKFFNYADPKYRKALAARIIRKIREYNIADLTPSDQNAFYNYYHPKTITHSGGDLMSDYYAIQLDDHFEHHGIKGQKWGVRRYQNSDGSLTAAGKKRYDKDSARASKMGTDVDTYRRIRRSASTGAAIAGLPGAAIGAAVSSHRAKQGKVAVGSGSKIGQKWNNFQNNHPAASMAIKVGAVSAATLAATYVAGPYAAKAVSAGASAINGLLNGSGGSSTKYNPNSFVVVDGVTHRTDGNGNIIQMNGTNRSTKDINIDPSIKPDISSSNAARTLSQQLTKQYTTYKPRNKTVYI